MLADTFGIKIRRKKSHENAHLELSECHKCSGPLLLFLDQTVAYIDRIKSYLSRKCLLRCFAHTSHIFLNMFALSQRDIKQLHIYSTVWHNQDSLYTYIHTYIQVHSILGPLDESLKHLKEHCTNNDKN